MIIEMVMRWKGGGDKHTSLVLSGKHAMFLYSITLFNHPVACKVPPHLD